MTQEQWDRAFKLFHEALDKAPSERAAFLDSKSPDAEIRAEVASLLANAREGDSTRAAPAIDGAREAIDEAFGAAAQGARVARREKLIAELTGTVVADRYQIVECIGKGGYAVVFLAVDLRVGRRKVVVKVMDGEDANRDWMERKFRQEIEVLAKINHPGVVGISDCGRLAGGQPFLVMNFVDGINLRERLKTPIGRGEAAEIMRQMGSALGAAHALGVVHLDLKPENIMLARSGETGPVTVKLIDFGIARVQHHKADETLANTLVAGTASYMAPEQFMGVTTPASDIYAMGVVCFEMLTGYRPQVLKPGHELPSGVGPQLTPAFDHAPEKRPADAEAFGNSLSATLMGGGSGRKLGLAIGAVAALALIAAGVYFWQRAHRPVLTNKDVLVLADFTNKTGDPVFDGTMREALAVALEQSPFLRVLDDTQMRTDMKSAGRDPAARITDDVARDLCVREGLKAAVGGSISRLGQRYAIGLRVTDCHSGDTLASEEIEADDKEHVLRKMAQAATAMRVKLGESLSSIKKLDQPLLYPVTTSSLEAFHAYALGMEEVTGNHDNAKIIPLFEHAVELDPQFATAWHLLGLMYLNSDDPRAEEDLRKAFSLSVRASEREKLEISASYQTYVTLDLDKAKEILEVYRETYPRASVAPMSLANIEGASGNYEKAVEDLLRAIDLDPGIPFYKYNLAIAYMNAGHPDNARALLQNLTLGRDSGTSHELWLLIARMTGDHASEAREVEWFSQRPEDEQASVLGQVYMASGQVRKSEKFLRGPEAFANNAELYSVAGDCERARSYALKSLPPRQVPDYAFPAGFAFAFCGGHDLAALTSDVSRRYPSATLWNRVYLPLIQAAQASRGGQSARALDLMRNTPYQRGIPEIGYLRGLVLLGLRNGPEAEAEFQRIVDGRESYFGGEIYRSASLVGLARAAVLSGDTAKAKKAYEDFFNLWKDADPDVPLLVAARKEYKLLQ